MWADKGRGSRWLGASYLADWAIGIVSLLKVSFVSEAPYSRKEDDVNSRSERKKQNKNGDVTLHGSLSFEE